MYKISLIFFVVVAFLVGCNNVGMSSSSHELTVVRSSQLDTFSLFNYVMCSSDTLNLKSKVNGGYSSIMSNKLLSFESSVTCNAFSSEKIFLSGSSYLTGNATAPIVDYTSGHISGTVTIANVDLVQFPEIDTLSFYNVALANSQVYASGYVLTVPNSTFIIPGGVMYVQGDVNISINRTNRYSKIVGCIVASGNINYGILPTSCGMISHEKSSVTDVILMSINGNIVSKCNPETFNGLIYVNNGNYTKTNQSTTTLTGQILVNGKVNSSYVTYKLTYQKMLPKIN
jgi:hypothetical protein